MAKKAEYGAFGKYVLIVNIEKNFVKLSNVSPPFHAVNTTVLKGKASICKKSNPD